MREIREELMKVVQEFRTTETSTTRGPAFTALAYAIEDLMRDQQQVRYELLLACFGPPDQFDGDGTFVYIFDHQTPGVNDDAWYFCFQNGLLTSSGYNILGINDHSKLRTMHEWPAFLAQLPPDHPAFPKALDSETNDQ
jgi:hypothetical protein